MGKRKKPRVEGRCSRNCAIVGFLFTIAQCVVQPGGIIAKEFSSYCSYTKDKHMSILAFTSLSRFCLLLQREHDPYVSNRDRKIHVYA